MVERETANVKNTAESGKPKAESEIQKSIEVMRPEYKL
jgi:hypothetical protein